MTCNGHLFHSWKQVSEGGLYSTKEEEVIEETHWGKRIVTRHKLLFRCLRCGLQKTKVYPDRFFWVSKDDRRWYENRPIRNEQEIRLKIEMMDRRKGVVGFLEDEPWGRDAEAWKDALEWVLAGIPREK